MALIHIARLHDIISRKSQINLQLLNLRQKLMDLQSYAAGIGDGVSIDDLMTCPSSLFQRMSIFKMTSDQAAYAQAQQNFGAMMAMNPQAMSQIQPQYQQQYQAVIFQNLFQKSQEEFGKVERKLMDSQETKIQQQIAQLETQGQMLDAEEKTTKEAISKDAENSAPKYA